MAGYPSNHLTLIRASCFDMLFISTLKQSWIRRHLSSASKWTIYSDDFELRKALQYGPDNLERIKEMTSNPFWLGTTSEK